MAFRTWLRHGLRVFGFILLGWLGLATTALMLKPPSWPAAGLLLGLSLWISAPILSHARGQHRLAVELWASFGIGVGGGCALLWTLLKGLRC